MNPRVLPADPTLRCAVADVTGMETVAHSARPTVEAVDGVHLTQLAVGEEMSVQHFHIEPGATVPEHSHHHEQTGYVFRGTFTFLVDSEGSETLRANGEAVSGEEHVVGAGDSYAIPGDEPHAAENRTDEPVEGIDVFAPPRENPDWME
jgi:quercetin dioxygenase-like cupin family protein